MKENPSQHFVGKVAQKIILECNGKFLAVRGNGDLVWEFPGGRLHNDEEPIFGLIREIHEELGISIVAPNPFHVVRSFHVSTNTYRVLIFYHAIIVSDVYTLDRDELEEARWVTAEELEELSFFEDCQQAIDVFFKGFR